jgi:hypothetical protein
MGRGGSQADNMDQGVPNEKGMYLIRYCNVKAKNSAPVRSSSLSLQIFAVIVHMGSNSRSV